MAKKKSDAISDAERDLFRKSLADVRPLHNDKIAPHAKKTRPSARNTERENRLVMEEALNGAIVYEELETGEELLFSRPGIRQNTMRKLRRGQFTIDAVLDLHGCTVAIAKTALTEFINRCRVNGDYCVRIIHGKGLGSPGKKPVIKSNLNHWLQQRSDVLAFCSARLTDGGTGAVYVLLKHM